jgi:transposase
MGMSYSEDLRRRVVGYVRQGGSKAEAARRFEISLWCVKDWVKRGDNLTAGKPGPRGSHKLDWQALQVALKQRDDATLAELAQQFRVSHNAVWYALKRLKISRKKRLGATRKRCTMRSDASAI